MILLREFNTQPKKNGGDKSWGFYVRGFGLVATTPQFGFDPPNTLSVKMSGVSRSSNSKMLTLHNEEVVAFESVLYNRR